MKSAHELSARVKEDFGRPRVLFVDSIPKKAFLQGQVEQGRFGGIADNVA